MCIRDRRNAVYEALCGSRGVDCVYLQRGACLKGVAKILSLIHI